MRATSHNRLVHSRLDAQSREADRFTDLQLEFRAGDRPLARFGGRWDRHRKGFAGDAARSAVVHVHGFQVAAIDTFDRWLMVHLQTRDASVNAHARTLVQTDAELDADARALIGLSELFVVGGRRSGKSVVMLLMLVAYAISVPGSIVWCVVPSEGFYEEPRAIVEEHLPHVWFRYRGDPAFKFEFINGSSLNLRTAVKPANLKKGKAALVGFNEGQQISEASYATARGATVDAGGACIVAANPPMGGDQTWILDACTAIQRGERRGAALFQADPTTNPHISQAALLALRSSMDLHTWETQVRGRLLEMPGSVLYTWSRAINERKPFDFGKVTHEFLTAHEGDRANWQSLIAVDVQLYPYIAAAVFEVFRDPDDADPKAGLLFMVDEVAIAQGDEVDVCDELKRRGIVGDRTLVIMDASCWWQQAQRDSSKQRAEYRGRGSADIFKRAGFVHTVRPDRSMKGNPDVIERIRATNATIRGADAVPHLFVDPERCPHAVKSVRSWRMRRGKPSRTADAAHFGDVLGYAVWRFWPRRGTGIVGMQSEGIPRQRDEDILALERMDGR